MTKIRFTPKMRQTRRLITGLILFFVLPIMAILDFLVISPLLLPADTCYYHTRETPLWVDFFYIGGGNNGHPEPFSTLPHLVVLFILTLMVSYWIAGRLTISYHN